MPGAVVDLRAVRTGRQITQSNQTLRELAEANLSVADMFRRSAQLWSDSEKKLGEVNKILDGMLNAIAVEQDYCARCQSAAEGGDLNQMIRQRDLLAGELDRRHGKRKGPDGV